MNGVSTVTPVRPGNKIQLKPDLALTLPTEVSTPSGRFEDYTFLIYGERKIGKTTLLSRFQDPFFLMFEPGGKALRIRQRFCPSWEHFIEYIKLLEKNPKYCSTVVLDTGYMCYEKCFEYSLRKLGVTSPQDKAWGAAWKYIDKEFRDAHQRLFNTGIAFAVTAHSEIREVTRKDGTKYDKINTQLGGQAFRFYAGIVDTIAYYQYDAKGRRILTIRGDSHVEAGCRISGRFLYSDTKLPMQDIDMGTSESGAYQNLVNAFNNKIPFKKS